MNIVPDLSAYVRSGTSGSSPARAPPRIATASVTSTRRGSDSDPTQRTNPLSAFDTRDVSCYSNNYNYVYSKVK